MTLRLVLDTNVVLDLLHFADPAALPIMAALESGRATCWADSAAHEELERVTGYPELKIGTSAGIEIVRRYAALARMPPSGAPPSGLPVCRDPDDQKFIELAARLPADLLLSRDKALLRLAGRRELPFAILTPAAAAGLFGSGGSDQAFWRRKTGRSSSDAAAT